MHTRNQSKKNSENSTQIVQNSTQIVQNSSSCSSYIHGVDFHENLPIIALPAVNRPPNPPKLMGSSRNDVSTRIPAAAAQFPPPFSSAGGMTRSAAGTTSTTPAAAASSPVSSAASPVGSAATRPLRTQTNNKVLLDICKIRNGELMIVPPKVAAHYKIMAGPVENLNPNDPGVISLFDFKVPPHLQAKPMAAMAVASVTGTSMLSDPGNSANSGPVNPVNSAEAHHDILTQNINLNAITTGIPSPSAQIGTNSIGSNAQIGMNSSLEAQVVVEKIVNVEANVVVEQIPIVNGGRVDVNGIVKEVGRAPVVTTMSTPTPTQNHNSTTQPPPSVTWAGLFKNNRAPCEDTKLFTNYDGMTSEKVVLNDDDLDDDDEEKRSLIGFVNGKFPGIKAIENIVDSWPRKCSLHQHNSGWLIFTFEDEKDCDIVMNAGPFYAFNKPLVLKKMPEFFDFGDDAYSTAPVWVQLPNLPLRAWKKKALSKICSFIGTPLNIDQVTKEKYQKSFARCLVDMDVSKELPTLVCCDLPRGKFIRQHVLYEEVPTFCANCKKLGHETEDCYASTNGAPSLYVPRSVKEKEKKKWEKRGPVGNGKTKNGNGQGLKKSGPTAPTKAADPVGTGSGHGIGLGPGTSSTPIGGEINGSRMATRQAGSTPNAPVGNINNGKNVDANPKGSSFVSANSFGALENENVGSLAEVEEPSNARNNKNKKKNGRKK